MRVSEWAARRRKLSSKGSSIPGDWDNSRNPLLVEIMDCFSARSPVHDVVGMLPIQFGKSEVEANILGYSMEENPGPIMVVLPGEVSAGKWIDQKLNPLIEETPALQRVLTSVGSRESSNRRSFKDFQGGQLYIEHAGNPVRLKGTSAMLVLVDEFSSFASELKSGDDPDELLNGRSSAFPSTYKRLKVGTPEIAGRCRVSALYALSDRRRWYFPCPDCQHEQPFEWSGLHWNPEATHCWYACRDCGVVIEEYQKTRLIASGQWVPENPESKIRGYHANALYYPMGLGPRWLDLVHMWQAAQGDPAKLKTFINDRLAEPWEDPAMRAVKFNIIADRAEPLPLRPVPHWVLAATAGVDTQDNRLAVQILGWGRGMACWPIDYVELPGDPNDDAVWAALTDLLSTPIEHSSGALLRIDGSAQDMFGHRTEAVKSYVRSQRIRRHIAIFGATANNAVPLGKGKLQEINWRGNLDKRGVHAYPVGTVAIKNMLYSLLGSDADKQPEQRRVRFSDELGREYFGGLTSETYNPKKNRYEKTRGAPRNEPLDTWVYGYAAALHPELRLNRWTKANWDAREAQLLASVEKRALDSRETSSTTASVNPANVDSRETQPVKQAAAAAPAWKRRW
jgi:phage terminase large subunit GpA-like protein